MDATSTRSRARGPVLIAALIPGVGLLAIVAVRYAGQLSDNQGGSIGLAALILGGLLLSIVAVGVARGVPAAKIALLAWSIVFAFALVYAGRATYKALKIDPRVHADGYERADWVRDHLREERASEATYWQPYLYWRRVPYSGDTVNVDDRGIRKTWRAPGTGPDDPLIFVFGGSTVWGAGSPDNETIPSFLARQLAGEGTRARVVNLGEAGYVSTQGLIRLTLELRGGNVPDAVVFYDGFNDCQAATQAGDAGIPFNESRRREDYLKGRGAEPPPLPERTPDELARRVADYYRANLRAVGALAREYGFEPLCFLQPVPYIEKPLTEYEQAASGKLSKRAIDAIRRSYAAIAEREFPHYFHDLRSVFADCAEPRYLDWCHIVPEGNAEVVRAMLPVVRDALRRHADKR